MAERIIVIMPNNDQPTEEGPRSFSLFLQQLSEGEAHVECSKLFHELLATLHAEASKKGQGGVASGKLTLTLGVKVEAKGVVGVSYDVATKEPKPERGGDVFWLTKGKNLSRENPRQQKLPLHEVSKPEAPREVSEPAEPARSV